NFVAPFGQPPNSSLGVSTSPHNQSPIELGSPSGNSSKCKRKSPSAISGKVATLKVETVSDSSVNVSSTDSSDSAISSVLSSIGLSSIGLSSEGSSSTIPSSTVSSVKSSTGAST